MIISTVTRGVTTLQTDVEPLPGKVVPRFVRCGQPGCRCLNGQPHGPYYYRVWREGNKVCKAYVEVTKIGQVQQQIELHNLLVAELRRLRKQREDFSASLARQEKISLGLMGRLKPRKASRVRVRRV